MLKWVGIDPSKKILFSGVSTMCRQLVTSANHLDGVDLMVLSGVGGSCVLLRVCDV